MKSFLNKLAGVFALAVFLLFSTAESKADVPMMQFAESISIGASVDTTYQYVFGCDTERAQSCPGERGLYPEHNDFSIDAFTLSLEKEVDSSSVSLMDRVGFRADILFGEQAERLGFGFGSDGNDGSVSPYQAYINIAPINSLNIYAGQFSTLAGWELIEAKENTNISRSLLFYRIPFAHSGARFAYNMGSIDLTFGISNDWDAVDDVDDGKTFEFQAAYSHSSETGFLYGLLNDMWVGLTAYVGKSEFLESDLSDRNLYDSTTTIGTLTSETAGSIEESDNNTRTLVTLVSSFTSGKFTFIGDAEFTWVNDGVTEGVYTDFDPDGIDDNGDEFPGLTDVEYDTFFRWGVGGYAIYQMNPNTTLSLRAEYVDDSDTSSGVKLFEVTPTVGWKPFGESKAGTLETRFEYRWDRADEEYFPTDSGLEKDQHALLFQLLYWI